jgi:cytochrome c oxidase subunit 2
LSAIRLGIVSLVIGAVGAVAIYETPSWFGVGAAAQADRQDTLYLVLMIISSFIFAIVCTFLFYSMWRFRARPGDLSDGPPVHGHTTLEIVWTAIPTIIVLALGIYGYVVLRDNESLASPGSSGPLQVNVTGQQFEWTFEYPDQKVTSGILVLPVDRKVDFTIRSPGNDVIHSFWVPAFRLKQDAVPGQVTHLVAEPDRLGTYAVVCAELCGIGHSQMRSVVRVVTASQFDDFIANAQKQAKQQAGGGGNAGLAAFNSGNCGSCHTFAPAQATGKLGPDLDNLAADAEKYGKGESVEDYVRESIVDPRKVIVSGFSAGIMPANFGQLFSPAQIDALVKLLVKEKA